MLTVKKNNLLDGLRNNFNNDTVKIILLACYFFLVFGAYTLLKDLKDSIFIITVGAKFIPQIKMISLFLMIPMVMFYSWLSTKIRIKTLVIFYTLFYGIGSLLIAYFIKHPIIGLMNTVSDQYRFFGWITYLFLEGASPFLVSLSWSFLNSISHPKDVKNTYLVMTIMTKLGGALFAGFAWFFLTNYSLFFSSFSGASLYSLIMFIASLAILILPILIFIMSNLLSEEKLVGYHEKYKESGEEKKFQGFGLFALLKNTYVLSIFGMIFFWEIVNFIFNNIRLNIAFDQAVEITDVSAYLFKSTMFMHLIGLALVVFGTTIFVRYLGERIALLLIPILIGAAIFIFLLYQNPLIVIIVYPFIGAINYSLFRPLRESLFIVTSKNIQFSTKSWIDSFGTKFSKSCGSLYTIAIQYLPSSSVYLFQMGFFVTLIGFWVFLAYYLGGRWQDAIKKNKIIS